MENRAKFAGDLRRIAPLFNENNLKNGLIYHHRSRSFISQTGSYGLSALSGCLLCLSFPRWEFSLLAWVALIPLFFAILDQSVSRAFFLGWITGIIFFSGSLSWISFTLNQYGGISHGISLLLTFFLLAYLSVYFGLFTALLRYVPDRRLSALFLAPAAWATTEFIRGQLFTGFPWALLGYSQYRFLPVIQIADFGSVYAVGFVLVLVNFALFKILHIGWKEKRIAVAQVTTAFGVLAFTLFYGMFRLSQPMGDGPSLSVSVVQGNIDQAQKWDTPFREETFQTYKRLSLMNLEGKSATRPELVIWPEAALPFFFEDEPDYRSALLDLSRKGNFHLLFGSPAYSTLPSGRISLSNSAYLLSPENRLFSRYDKMHLVPFGEYVPLSSLLSFVNKMVEGLGDFVPGREAKLMAVGETRIGTVICFEVIFPEMVRQFVKKGAVLMTTITNDAWFGRSAAPYQHFSMVVFRAIENRVPFARAANTGISGFIDATGKITQQSPLFVETSLSEELLPGNRRTLYTLYGDFFVMACAIITLIFCIFEQRKRRKANAL
ncbi:MAG: apolipoprotein N-acyltransferase [Nitrospira sp.]|nr:apolipoprotein N-acyltransferase [Candidatus Manganitrophaceae bacterium]HIL35227.1 apolipoprotein N-acyltransferase [Candidatus Manganitrophaceae bacterium]